MCMSSAAANLNSSSVVLTHDFLTPLGFKFKYELILSKPIALTIGSVIFSIFGLWLTFLVFMTQSYNLVVNIGYIRISYRISYHGLSGIDRDCSSFYLCTNLTSLFYGFYRN